MIKKYLKYNLNFKFQHKNIFPYKNDMITEKMRN